MAFSSASRSVKLYFTGDSRQLERTIGRVDTKLKKFGSGSGNKALAGGLIGNIGRSGGIALGLGIVTQQALKFTQAAADQNEQLGKSRVVFGQYSKGIEDFAKTAAKSYGLSDDAVLQLAGSYGALLRPLGLSQQAAAKFGVELTKLGADLASFYNTDPQQALEAIQSGLTGQVRPLRAYGVELSAARVQQVALATTGKQTARELTDQDKVLARIKIIMKDTALAQGDFARSSGRLAQQEKILSAQVANLESNIGEKLIPAMTKLVGVANDGFTALGHLGNGFKAADSASGGFLSNVLEKTAKLSYYFNPLTGPILGGINAINSAFGGTKKQLEDITKLAGQFSDSFGVGALTAAGAAKTKPGGVPSFGEPGFKVGKPNEVFRPGPSVSLRNQIFDNSISRRLDRVQDIGSLSGQINTLQGIKGTIQNQISKTKDLTRRLNLGDEVVEINRQIKGLNETIAQNLKDSAQAVKDAREKLASQLKQQAEDFKSKALQLLDNRTSQRTSKKDLQDALSDLRVAKQLGSAGAIKNAQFAVANARDQLTRSTLEGGTVRATGSGTYNFNGANLHFYGVTNVKQLLAEIQKAGRHGTSQTRGVIAGRNLNLGFGV